MHLWKMFVSLTSLEGNKSEKEMLNDDDDDDWSL